MREQFDSYGYPADREQGEAEYFDWRYAYFNDLNGEQLMDINAAFPSRFLKHADLQGREHTVKMDVVIVEDLGDGPKPVLSFAGKDKGLVLNVINKNRIVSAYGPETDNWRGKEIILYPTTTEFQGVDTPCIRVRVEKDDSNQVGDDIPF